MDREDISLAFQSHSTSKLVDPEDLFHITTMGFRGEALPSIGSVARAGIISRTTGADLGCEINIDGGKLDEAREKGCPEGTTVIVRNIFFNTPVRLKFLKSDKTELSHIVSIITRIALANCHIRFELLHNGKRIFLLGEHDTLLERVRHFYGDEVADGLLPLESHTMKVHITGLIAAPPLSRRDARMQHIYLNTRPIRERVAYAAIKGAYEGLLTSGRNPIVFVFIDIDPREVDVNVHPTKTEVRFRNPSAVHAQLRASMRDVLAQVASAPLAPATEGISRGPETPAGSAASSTGAARRTVRDYFAQRHDPRSALLPFRTAGRDAGAKAASLGGVRCFQVHDSYIVVETGEGLEIIDQHALHEKIIYERLLPRGEGERTARQQMLIPPTIELSTAQWADCDMIIDALALLGFEVEPFGGRSLLVRALPEAVADADAVSMLRDMIEEVCSTGKTVRMEQLRDSMRKTAACRAAVKAGQKLSDERIGELLARREDLIERYSCPHGRPIALRFTLEDLEKRFHRK